MAPLLSVIIPTYKQEKTITSDLKRVLDCLHQAKINFELIVVVDGAMDDSFQVAKKVKDARIKVYQLEKNHGKGYAIRYGMARSKGQALAFIDAGMEINPEGLVTLMNLLEIQKADIVVGSKRHPES